MPSGPETLRMTVPGVPKVSGPSTHTGDVDMLCKSKATSSLAVLATTSKRRNPLVKTRGCA